MKNVPHGSEFSHSTLLCLLAQHWKVSPWSWMHTCCGEAKRAGGVGLSMAGAHTVPSTPKHTGRMNEYMNEKNLLQKCHIYLQLSDKETGPCNAK